jgi:predicted DNA-binding protein
MSRQTKVLGFSLPPEMAKEYEDLAKKERKTKSELFREMIELYKQVKEEKEFYRLQERISRQAKKLEVSTEEDVERLIHEARSAG